MLLLSGVRIIDNDVLLREADHECTVLGRLPRYGVTLVVHIGPLIRHPWLSQLQCDPYNDWCVALLQQPQQFIEGDLARNVTSSA